MTYKELINSAIRQMESINGSTQAPFLLMLEIANKEAHDLYMEYETEVDANILSEYNEKLELLLKGMPLQHILGFEYFYGYKFKVNEDVLIPRAETEELVSYVLAAYDEHFSDKEDVTLIDVGTGSGAIAISLKLEEPRLNIIASDISKDALDIALTNAKDNSASLAFVLGDMLNPFIDKDIKVDILVSNPPYIPVEEEIEVSVKDYEPHVALFGGNDGLKFYDVILANAHKILNEKSMLAFEMGYNQKEALLELASKYYPSAKIEVIKDMSNKDRMLFIYNL